VCVCVKPLLSSVTSFRIKFCFSLTLHTFFRVYFLREMKKSFDGYTQEARSKTPQQLAFLVNICDDLARTDSISITGDNEILQKTSNEKLLSDAMFHIKFEENERENERVSRIDEKKTLFTVDNSRSQSSCCLHSSPSPRELLSSSMIIITACNILCTIK
jgi:hypothetical protein